MSDDRDAWVAWVGELSVLEAEFLRWDSPGHDPSFRTLARAAARLLGALAAVANCEGSAIDRALSKAAARLGGTQFSVSADARVNNYPALVDSLTDVRRAFAAFQDRGFPRAEAIVEILGGLGSAALATNATKTLEEACAILEPHRPK
jgi:hypothetical protein